MDQLAFDERGRFIVEDYAAWRPFSSFLPGIAGPWGIPLWVFYVNRGQAIASFGLESKDHPIIEFQPANKAYQTTPYTGFRTFLKVRRGPASARVEPFAPWQPADQLRMLIGMNELELQTTQAAHGLQTNVLYFTLPGEPFAGLIRQVTVKNIGPAPMAVELLDGLPQIMPYGVNQWGVKEISRTLEAWMEVCNLEQGRPFYRLCASADDTAEVADIRAGNFYLAFRTEGTGTPLPAFVDPAVIFGQDTAFSAPERFWRQTLGELAAQRQITVGKTPCALFGAEAHLEPGESLAISAVIGQLHDCAELQRQAERLAQPGYLAEKREEAGQLVRELTSVVETQTSSPVFNAYCRQTFLDNVLRGGWPLYLGEAETPRVYHIYSRKHGDLERDYNAFYLAAEPYSQGNGNYRDVNQNRRNDVFFNPRIKDFNVLTFLGLLQADGYNPLVVNSSRFSVPPAHQAVLLDWVDPPERLAPYLAQPFTPGQLLRVLTELPLTLKVPATEFLAAALANAEQHFEATFSEGYWVDHWFYNLDLLESYLAVYPDQQAALLFGKPVVPFFDSPAAVQPRARKYVLVGDQVRQYNAVTIDAEKAALLAVRTEQPNLVRTEHGRGTIYRTTVFAKLLGLAWLKFATLDPWGMGIEMEAGKPGWYDALNGLPGLFGSSLPETFELERLLGFLAAALADEPEPRVSLPIEFAGLAEALRQALADWEASGDPQRDYRYWDTVATARETFREQVRLGFAGPERTWTGCELLPWLEAARARVQAGLRRALELNQGVPPTYFTYTVTDYERLTDAAGRPLTDAQGRPYVQARRFEPVVLPLFLEGPVHALKIQPDAASARRLYAQVRESPLFDRALRMYRVNASLAAYPHEIGRARAFTPGWLENESIWLHMAYKYLLEVLKAGLYEEFFEDFKYGLIPFRDLRVYGRSLLENSSFIVSSAHPDESLHGAGFVARFTGATAEFLSIWQVLLTGGRPFVYRDGALSLALRPVLPGWLFAEDRTISFVFLGQCAVTYHNLARGDTFREGMQVRKSLLQTPDGEWVELRGSVIGAPYAAQIRAGQIKTLHVFLGSEDEPVMVPGGAIGTSTR